MNVEGGGGPWVERSCGKEYLCVDSRSNDEEDIQWMNDALVNHSKTCIKVEEYDCVEYKRLDDKIYVYDCECGGIKNLKRYEEWIWENRHLILPYLRDSIAKEKE